MLALGPPGFVLGFLLSQGKEEVLSGMRRTKALVRIGFLAACGLVLTFFEFPILPSATFLKYDASEVPALLAGFGMGPAAGMATLLLKCVLFHFSGKNMTGLVGVSAMFVAGTALVLPASLVYSRMRTMAGALLSLLVGTISITVVMFFANMYIFLPLWNIPEQLRMSLLTTAVIPFNLLKGFASSAITFVLYKRVAAHLKVSQPA